MSHVFRNCIGKIVVVYFDDILVYSFKTFEGKNQLFANIDKCTFCIDSVIFLVFIVNKNEFHVDPDKIKVIEE